jgi:hypothetical protein
LRGKRRGYWTCNTDWRELLVDYTVFGPGKAPGQELTLFSGEKERQGDFVFTANQVGEYRFCFDNTISTFSEKLIDFEISVRTTLHGTF